MQKLDSNPPCPHNFYIYYLKQISCHQATLTGSGILSFLTPAIYDKTIVVNDIDKKTNVQPGRIKYFCLPCCIFCRINCLCSSLKGSPTTMSKYAPDKGDSCAGGSPILAGHTTSQEPVIQHTSTRAKVYYVCVLLWGRGLPGSEVGLRLEMLERQLYTLVHTIQYYNRAREMYGDGLKGDGVKF